MTATQRIDGIAILKSELEKQNLSVYKMAKLINIKQSTLYSYMNGKIKMPPTVCHAIADVLGQRPSDLFPQCRTTEVDLVDLRDKADVKFDYTPEEIKEKFNITKEEAENITKEAVERLSQTRKITVNDMIVGAAELAPDDGITLKLRSLLNSAQEILDGCYIQMGEMFIVKTGVRADTIDLDRVLLKGIKKYIISNNVFPLSFPVKMDNELCVVLCCNSERLLLYRGIEVAKLIFI